MFLLLTILLILASMETRGKKRCGPGNKRKKDNTCLAEEAVKESSPKKSCKSNIVESKHIKVNIQIYAKKLHDLQVISVKLQL